MRRRRPESDAGQADGRRDHGREARGISGCESGRCRVGRCRVACCVTVRFTCRALSGFIPYTGPLESFERALSWPSLSDSHER